MRGKERGKMEKGEEERQALLFFYFSLFTFHSVLVPSYFTVPFQELTPTHWS